MIFEQTESGLLVPKKLEPALTPMCAARNSKPCRCPHASEGEHYNECIEAAPACPYPCCTREGDA